MVSSESVHNRKRAGGIGYLNIMNSIELREKEREMNDVEWQEMICCRMDRWHEMADIELKLIIDFDVIQFPSFLLSRLHRNLIPADVYWHGGECR